ncbi:MAG: T9SS type A sorting domain-containing protein [Bacteroidetes bacterium]|nr:T9SS type A sorting domain-containing protein [Bacteroidota bacterium]
MKNQKRIVLWISSLLFMLISIGIKAQTPTYQCRITNAAQVSCNVYEFDVVMQRTGGTVLKLAQFQLGILLDPAIIPSGGIINVAPVPGSSELLAAQQPGPEKFSFDATKNCIQVTPVAPPGAAGATIISNAAAGTRLTRIRVACTAAFNTGTNPNHTWNFVLSNGYQTKMFAYVGSTNTNITVNASHTLVAPANPVFAGGFPDPIAQTVTSDVTQYCNLPGAGATISLANTQLGYTYYLYSNGTQVTGIGGVVFGTGSGPVSFATLATGATMSVKSPSCTGLVSMANTISLTSTQPLNASVAINASPATTVPPGYSCTYTATPVNGGPTPTYQWYVNNVADYVNGFNSTYIYTPVNGDQLKCELYSSETCVTPAIATSNVITMTVMIIPPPTAFAVTGGGSYCQGGSGAPVGLASSEANTQYTLYQGGSPIGSPVPGGNGTPITFGNQLAGTYTVSGTNLGGTTAMLGSVTITETPNVPVSVTIAEDANSVCAGTTVVVTATPVNGGTPTYVWHKNASIVGTNSPTYSFVPVNGDQVYVVMTSSITCVTGSPATSNTVTMTVIPTVPISVSVAADVNPVCAGSAVLFTATPTNGGTPAYQWYVNNLPVGTDQATYSYVPATGDQVHVVMTSSLTTCVVGNPATSNTVTLTVNPIGAASVSVAAGSNPSCGGNSVTYTATPVFGGPTPAYQWYVNALPVGTNSSTLSYVPVDGDLVSVSMTSSDPCATGSPATSNTITMSVTTPLVVSVSVLASATTVCAGTSVTFTATPGNGGTPTYQWYVNSLPVGNNQDTYTYVPLNNDQVYVVMSSTLGCVASNPATSNTVTMIVNPIVNLSVSIVASENPICSGSSVTFTASTAKAPASPLNFQWYLNGSPVGSGSSTYTYVPSNNDQVYVVYSTGAACTVAGTSNTITISVTSPLPVSVLVLPSENPVCQGTSVTFTASPTNGGVASYQWYVNSLPVGTNQATYTYVPLNNDQVYVSMTSGLGCVSGNPASSNVVSMSVNAPDPVSVSIVATANPVCNGTSVTFTALPVNGGVASYQWYVNSLPVGTNQDSYTFTPLNNDQVSVVMTSSFTCISGNPATSNVLTMTVNPILPVSVSIAASANPVCAGSTVVMTATPTNGGTPTYQWYLNSLPVGTNSATYSFVPIDGDQAYVVLNSGIAACISGNPATSNTVAMTVIPGGPAAVTIIASNNNVCNGTSVTFTATPANGGVPSYQWYVNSLPVGTDQNTYSYVPVNGDIVHVVMTSSLTCTTGNPATSNTITMVVNTPDPVSVSISESANTVCAGTQVTFTATPTNGGTPAYQWYVNSLPVGTNQATYTYAPLTGDQVYVIMTSSLGCITGSPATSNTVTMIVNPLIPLSVSISASANPVCLGASVTFTASVAAKAPQSAANYQWYVNTILVTTGTSTYSYVPANNDQVYVVYSESIPCTVPGTSNTITMVVNNPLPVSVSVAPSSNNVCAGSTVTFTATPTNGGTASYQWYLNSLPVGLDQNTYSYVPVNGDQVYVIMTSSLSCISGSPATSNTVTMIVNDPVAVSVTMAANANPVCAGNQVTYTATPVNGGPTPSYQWFVNSLPVGTGGATYTYAPVNGDLVAVELTTSLTCVLNTTSLSNTVTMTVNPLIPVSVSINASANPVCAGTSVTYSVAAGKTPSNSYQWYVNGAPVGTDATSYTYTPANNDQVYVVMTANITCPSGSPATSNIITMTVNPIYAVSVSISPSANPICSGNSVTLTATPVNGGTPTYQWYVNTLPVGTGLSTYTYTPVNGDQVYVVMTSDHACTTGNPATSNTVTMSVLLTVPVTLIITPSANPVCAGTPVTFTALSNVAASSYQWYKNSVAVGTNLDTYTFTPSNNDQVYVVLTPVWGCATPNPATSAVATMTVNPIPVPTLAGPASVCINSSGNVYSTEAGKSNYVWNVSVGGTITSGGTSTDNTVTVTWTSVGAQTVDVTYSANSCVAASPAVYNVTVNPLPVPTITGPASVCLNSTGNVYTTQAGMTNYAWVVPAGGTITAGGTATSNTVTVTWTTAGPQTVSVNYVNANSCTAVSPTVYNVTVNPLPVPTISGPAAVCAGACGNVYTTESGMTGYSWSLSAGGTITAGAGTNSITVCWNTAGAQTVSVNYSNANSCTAASATVYNVTVNALPVPTVTGPASACVSSAGNVYSTQAGMSGYIWNVSAGGTITAGSGTNSVTVTWNTAGAQTVSVNYTNGNSCTAASATIYNVTVNPLPVPTITGPASVCVNSTGNVYTTQAGMSGYTWNISAGGVITAGNGTNSITVNWISTGPQTVSVNYTNGNSCTAAAATIYNVTVNALPVPTISGPSSVCVNSCTNVYVTEAGMTNYTWTISAGGTITAGGTATSSSVTVCWNTVGARTVSVNYSNGNSCTAAAATVYNVTVNALPVPTITGPASICAGTTGNVYTTQAGMTGYTWTVSAGGAITAGAGTNAITVTWNTAGAQTVSVNYTNGNSCTAASATIYNVTVNALPVPTITGTTPAGVGSTQVYTTQAGMTNYIWTVSAGGTVTAGGTATSNTVTVQWTTAGAQSVSVNYTNAAGCSAASATVFPVSVISVPPPAGPITGVSTVCQGATGVTYSVAAIPNATGYTWTLPAGATIATGANTNSITVNFSNTAVSGVITVMGTNSYGNGAPSPNFSVTVLSAPVPTITGDNDLCQNSDYYYYTTEAGMTNYVWNISPNSGTITWVTGSNQVMIYWNSPGAHWVSVSYTNPGGCTAATPTVYNVTVHPLPAAAGAITGTATVCAGATGITYSVATVANATSYAWTVPTGASITAGATTNTITVSFGTSAISGSITVSAVNDCGNGPTSPAFAVTINPLPSAAGAITGPGAVCQGTQSVVYTVGAITNATGYHWTVPTGATIVSGSNTNSVTVDFDATASSGVITVYGTNACGDGAASSINVTLNPIPQAPVITLSGFLLTSSAPAGNQWYYNGEIIAGANGQTYTALHTGNYYSVVTLNGCSSDTSNNVFVIYVGVNDLVKVQKVEVYPNPNDGRFTLSVTTASAEKFDLRIVNNLGVMVYDRKDMVIDGTLKEKIELNNIPKGIYSIILSNSDKQIVRKIVVD